MKTRLHFISLTALCICLSLPSSGQDATLTTKQVSDNIYMIQGRGGNIGISIGDDGVMLIDNKFEDLVPLIKDEIKQVTDQDIRFVINTHYHGDHTGGNVIFGEEGRTIVAHKNVYDRLSQEQVSTWRDRTTPPKPEEAWPLITFGHYITFHINDDKIQLMHFDRAHTDGDAVVYFEKDNVIHMGDVFVTYGYPFIDADAGGSLKGFIQTLDKILLVINDDTKVIPGHGNLSTKNDVQQFRDKLDKIRSKLKEEIVGKKDLNAVIAAKPLASYDEEWGNGFIKAKDFITLVYPEFSKN